MIDVQKLALVAGFEPYEICHLSGNGESDCICSVGEYPCGDSVRALIRLTLASVVEAANARNLWHHDDPVETVKQICAELMP